MRVKQDSSGTIYITHWRKTIMLTVHEALELLEKLEPAVEKALKNRALTITPPSARS